MSFDVSSWFIEQARAQTSAPLRRFTIGGSDYSEAVLRWPTLGSKAGAIDLGTTNVVLDNIDNAFSFFVDCSYFLTTSCELSLGYTHPESGAERVSLFHGSPSNLSFERDGKELRVQLQGKTKRLTNTSLGTDVESGGLDFTNSSYHPSDLAWTLVTCYGQMSPQQDDDNPDLHYSEWLEWKNSNQVKDVRVKAYLKGEKIYQVLHTLATMDGQIVSFQNGKLRFRDVYAPFDPQNTPFPQHAVLELGLTLDPDQIINHFFVEAGYDPGKASFSTQFSYVNSESQTVFGRRSGRFSSRSAWFSTAFDARYLSEDRVRFGAGIAPEVHIKAPLGAALEFSNGDIVSLTHSGFGWSDKIFRILEQTVNLETGLVSFRLREAQHRRWQYEAAVSSDNIFSPSLTRVASGAFLALGEQGGTKQVLRTDSSGFFQKTGIFANSILSINGTEVLFGGPPSSGSAQAVIQRSSDAGSSAVIVASLAPNQDFVPHIFEVRSGSYLASTNSGGIYRSTDSGSSWSLTQTISGAYQIHRFFQPFSGTLWGGTAYTHYTYGKGQYIWSSEDEGQSWSPTHTIHSSDNYISTAFHALPDSEVLLASYGGSIANRRVLRSKTTSPASVAWIDVLTAASFSGVVVTASAHLLAGFFVDLTVNGGIVYRSLDQGSSWFADSQLTKQGNIALSANSDGTLDAFVSRMSIGVRTDLYRNFNPDQLG